MNLARDSRSPRLFCFSPEVMIATCIIEIALALFALWRYRHDFVTKLAVALLVCLAAFQFAEFMICQGAPERAEMWARLGYVAITLLPVLGFHMIWALIGQRARWAITSAYVSAGLFTAYFLLSNEALLGSLCGGNYVIFEMTPFAVSLYALYYYSWMLIGVAAMIHFAKRLPRLESSLYGLAFGYAAFLVPTTVVNILHPRTIEGIPSIMCGFAVIFALTLVCWVLPKWHAAK